MLKIRRALLLGLLGVLVVSVPLAAEAASGGSSSSLDLQASRWTTSGASTASRRFAAIRQLSGLNVCAARGVTAELSVELHGSAAGFQIRVDGGAVMHPGAVRFIPSAPHQSFSFTFVQSVAPFEANDHHVFDVEWRSPTGRRTTLEKATLNLQYERGTHRC
jgi:hypothetical protein